MAHKNNIVSACCIIRVHGPKNPEADRLEFAAIGSLSNVEHEADDRVDEVLPFGAGLGGGRI